MAITKGSLILIDYTAKVKDSDEIFETTIEENAKKSNLYDPSIKYEPRLVSIGEGWVLKGLDEFLSTAKIGNNLNVDIPPDKAFGLRDPNKVRMIPQRKFGDKADEIKAGDVVDIDDRRGFVRFIGSGRVQVDFNHRLAGKTLSYNVNILKILKTDEEKTSSLVKRRILADSDKISISFNKSELTIRLPEESFLIDGLQVIKKAISGDLFKFIPSIESIKFLEIYNKSKPTSKAETDEAKAQKDEAKAQKDEAKAQTDEAKAQTDEAKAQTDEAKAQKK
ncbi:MAG: FKBP-type peptidyl-prolyl cis-trans isomerase [Nitrososphaeraceae archaeon]